MPRLLVVDDNDQLRHMFVEVLTLSGFEAIGASDGEAATALISTKWDFDALITDLRMPGRIDGTRLAALFRKQYDAAPVLFISGVPKLAADCPFRPGYDFLLAKPFTLGELVSTVEKMCSGRASMRVTQVSSAV